MRDKVIQGMLEGYKRASVIKKLSSNNLGASVSYQADMIKKYKSGLRAVADFGDGPDPS